MIRADGGGRPRGPSALRTTVATIRDMIDLPLLVLVIAIVVMLAVVAIAALVVVRARSTVAEQQRRVDAAWASIRSNAEERDGRLAELTTLVRGAADHETSVFDDVEAARGELGAAVDGPTASAAEDRVQGGIRRLLQVAEGYPDLQRDGEFLRLKGEIARAGTEIQTTRRHYNGAVREYNTRISTFPGSMVAGSLGATPRSYFEVADRAAIAEPPRVQF